MWYCIPFGALPYYRKNLSYVSPCDRFYLINCHSKRLETEEEKDKAAKADEEEDSQFFNMAQKALKRLDSKTIKSGNVARHLQSLTRKGLGKNNLSTDSRASPVVGREIESPTMGNACIILYLWISLPFSIRGQ